MENQLAHAITQTEYDSSYDKAAKKLLANKQILAQIMKNCVNEYSACSVDEIAEKYIEGTPEVGTVGVHVDDTNRPKKTSDVIVGSNNEDSTLTEGTINYDVRFDAIAPTSEDSTAQKDVIRLIINVEAQTAFNPGYPLTKRAIYYCSRMISAQHGPIFTNSEYGKIRKVYSIWVCTHPTREFQNTLIRYSIRPEQLIGNAVEKSENYDLMSTLDEDGIPATAEGRVKVAGKIIEEAKKYGIDKKDIVIDVLCMTISSEPTGAITTLEALRQVREKYGVCAVLGVSNISFGLPYRPAVNSNFYTMAMQSGLSAGIINPLSEDMMRSYYSFCALMNYDENCEKYIEQYGSQKVQAVTPATKAEMTLKTAIEKGLKEEAHHITAELVKDKAPLDIINEELIPALDQVGKGFEKGTVFLPQLLMSADAAKIAFAVLKDELAKSGESEQAKDKVILATVKGDIHDIGKNIVKVLLENYSFDVIDLGKDVPPEEIVETAIKEDVRLVGLSALMTTTVVSMEETIRQLRKKKPECKVMVGGAVLNQDYSDMIGADFYGKDAMQSVYYAQQLFGGEK